MATPSEESEKAKKQLKEVSEIVGVIGEGFRELTSRLTEAVEEIREGSNELNRFNLVTRDINRSLRSMSKVNEELIKNQIKLNQGKLTTKEVDESINKAIATRQVLMGRLDELQRKINNSTGDQAENLAKIADLQSKIDEISQEVENNFKKQRVEAERLEEVLGTTGKLLKGISKIPILGNIVDTSKALQAANTAAQNGASKFGAMSAAIKSVKQDIITNITDPLTITVFLITKTVEAFKRVDKGVGELAKGFNMTYSDALKTRQELTQIASLSGDAAVNTRGLQESMMAIGQTLGSNARLNEKDLVFMTKMRERAGFTNEELVEMQKLTFATGGTLENNTKNLLFAAKTTGLNNKVLLNEKDIMRDVAKASNAVKLSVVGGAEGLGRAAAQAKALGMNLNQLDNIAGGLLDFESSINAELEAQLLTGKNINLEQARLYALNNDMEGLSREIAKNVGTAEQFGKMNRLQQEAVAKAVGMTREELATTLTDQKALQGLSGKAAEDAKKALAGARARGMTEEEIREKGIKDLMAQQSTQEKFNQAMEKLQDIIGNLVNGPFGLFLEGLSRGLDIIGKIFAKFGQISGLIKGFLGEKIGGVLGDIASVATIGALIALVTKSMLKGTIFNPMVVTVAGGGMGGVGGGPGGGPGGGGGGMFSGGLGRLSKAFKGGGVRGAGRAATRILSKTAKANALTALLMGGLEAGSNIAEGKGAGESLGRAALTGLLSFGGGALGSLIAPGAGTIGGGIAGGMLGDKLGDMLFGEKVQDAIINPDGGLRVSGPKGMFSLDKNDTVVAGTDLNKKGNNTVDNSSVVSELREIKNILRRTLDVDIEMAKGFSILSTRPSNNMAFDVDKLGTIMNTNTYKTQ